MNLSSPPRIIASLTTVPERIQYLERIIKNLINQSMPFASIYIHIPYQSLKKKHYMIPKNLIDLAHYNKSVIINRIKEDLGPITKLLPVLHLERDPETIIVTFDDDILVHPLVSSIFHRKCQQYPDACLSFSGWCVGKFPYLYQLAISNNEDIACDWLQGVHGIAYRRKFLNEQEIMNFPAKFPGKIQSLLKMNDDHWISAYLEMKKISKISIGYSAREFFKALILPDNDKSISSQGGFWSGVHELSNYFTKRNIYNREYDSRYSVVFLGGIVALGIVIIFLVISRFFHTPTTFGLSLGFLILLVIWMKRQLAFRLGLGISGVDLNDPIFWRR